MAGGSAATQLLAVPDRVHVLFDLFTAEGRVKSAAAALRTIDASARRSLFDKLKALAEQSTATPFVRWACRRTMMAFPKQEYELEKKSVIEATLNCFVRLPAEELESAYHVLQTYRKCGPGRLFWKDCRERLRRLVCDDEVAPAARSWLLRLLRNDKELGPDSLIRILNGIKNGTSHAVYRDCVLQVSRMMRQMSLRSSEVSDVFGWAEGCVREFESLEDDNDLKVCDSAAWLMHRIADRFLPAAERAELLRHCVFLSDHKSRETRDVLFKILESYGTLATAELLECVRVTPHPDLGDSCHRFPEDCARLAEAIRRRLEEQAR